MGWLRGSPLLEHFNIWRGPLRLQGSAGVAGRTEASTSAGPGVGWGERRY